MPDSNEPRPQEPWPVELKLVDEKRALHICWDDNRHDTIEAEYLRVESPSAEVQGHSPADKKTVPGKKNVTIQDVLPVGTYAVRLVFSDGHSTGIFTWSYLRKLVDLRADIWGKYLESLAAKGLSRT
jgi:DUF971 family protein